MCNSWYSSPTLTNCTFVANSASYSGGGMGNYSSSPTLTNCTFVANSASYEGGGIYNGYSSSPTLTNCVIWGNGSGIYDYSGTSTVIYSDVQGGDTDTGNISADPQFVRSPWPGLDGVFGTADDDYGDLHLRQALQR